MARIAMTFPPVVHEWVNIGLGMSSHVCETGNIKDPVPLIERVGHHVLVVGLDADWA